MSRGDTTRQKVEVGLPRRRRKEFMFQAVGMLATTVGVLFLGVFFATLVADGASAFRQTFMQLDVEISEEVLAPGRVAPCRQGQPRGAGYLGTRHPRRLQHRRHHVDM